MSTNNFKRVFFLLSTAALAIGLNGLSASAETANTATDRGSATQNSSQATSQPPLTSASALSIDNPATEEPLLAQAGGDGGSGGSGGGQGGSGGGSNGGSGGGSQGGSNSGSGGGSEGGSNQGSGNASPGEGQDNPTSPGGRAPGAGTGTPLETEPSRPGSGTTLQDPLQQNPGTTDSPDYQTSPAPLTPRPTTPDNTSPSPSPDTTPQRDRTPPGTFDPDTSGVAPGRATRSGPSYIGVGGNIGLGEGDTALGEGSFAVFSKIGLTSNVSVRPSVLFSDDPTILLPITLDFIPFVTEATQDLSSNLGVRVSPFVGPGVAISTGDDGAVDFLVSGGVDVLITPRISATATVNASFFDNIAVGLLLGVGYNF